MKKAISAAILVFVMAGCSKSDAPDADPAGTPLIVRPHIVPRAGDTTFDNGDVVGLSITTSDDILPFYTINHKLVFDHTENCFKADPATPLKWYAADLTASFVAYYPYDDDYTPVFEVNADQSAKAGYTGSDFMFAAMHNVAPTLSGVTLQFNHVLSQLKLTLDNQEAGRDIISVKVRGSILAADIDYDNQTATVDTGSIPCDINTYADPDVQGVYKVIIIPQTKSLEVVIEDSAGKITTTTLASFSYEHGRRYGANITVPTVTDIRQVDVFPIGNINDWNPGGEVPTEP